MYSKIVVEDSPPFLPDSAVLDDLTKLVFVFGQNGSGKSTFADRLDQGSAQCEPHGVGFDVKVFSREYKEKFFASDMKPGVFLLGDAQPQLAAERDDLLGEINKRSDKIAAVRARLGTDDESGARGRLESARKLARNQAWRVRAELPTLLREHCFKGTANSRQKFLDTLRSAGQTVDSELTLEVLEARAAVLFQESPTQSPMIRVPTVPDFSAYQAWSLLGTSIAPQGSSDLAAALEHLGNADWFKSGRNFADKNDGDCPYCQQELPPDFVQQIAATFDELYDDQISQLHNLASLLRDDLERLDSDVSALESIERLQGDRLAALLAEYRTARERFAAELGTKIESPATVVKLPDLAPAVESLASFVRQANEAIKSENQKIASVDEERKKLILEVRAFVRAVHAREILETLQASSTRCEAEISELEGTIEESTKALREFQSEVKTLEDKLGSDASVIGYINDLLKSVGFHSFSLAGHASGEGYSLVREDGSFRAESLSEGEQAFVSFLYFFYEAKSAGSGEPRVLVIDDPISSLDGDALFSVSLLTRELMDLARDKSSTVSQVIVLTHNVYFYKEVTFKRDGKDCCFFTIEKRTSTPNVITRHDDNPIKSSYAWLWKSLAVARIDPTPDRLVGIQNSMRRILQTYFLMTGVSHLDKVLPESTSAEEKRAFNQLMSWANDGSHHIPDDFDFDPGQVGAEIYFDVFKKVFEVTRQTPHYDMMMNLADAEDELPEELAGLASTKEG